MVVKWKITTQMRFAQPFLMEKLSPNHDGSFSKSWKM